MPKKGSAAMMGMGEPRSSDSNPWPGAALGLGAAFSRSAKRSLLCPNRPAHLGLARLGLDQLLNSLLHAIQQLSSFWPHMQPSCRGDGLPNVWPIVLRPGVHGKMPKCGAVPQAPTHTCGQWVCPTRTRKRLGTIHSQASDQASAIEDAPLLNKSKYLAADLNCRATGP